MIAALTIAGCSTGGDEGGGEQEGEGGGIAAAQSEFWVDPNTDAAQQVRQWREEGRDDDANTLEKMARQPIAHWPTGDDANVEGETRDVVQQAQAAGRTPILVAYNIPNRDCGLFSAGGAEDDGGYRDYIQRMANGMSGTRSVVILEPDALAQTLTECEGQGQQEGREALLSDAVDILSDAGGEVYIDAGNPGFVTDVGQLAGGLRASGIERAAGFALNVSNFMSNDAVADYGRQVSDQVDGKPFVIDTSRNGNGDYDGPEQPTWCNPPGRALGTPPTRDTGQDRVAAYLWIKTPGDSDGSCRDGAPEAGQWMPDYALGLAQAAQFP